MATNAGVRRMKSLPRSVDFGFGARGRSLAPPVPVRPFSPCIPRLCAKLISKPRSGGLSVFMPNSKVFISYAREDAVNAEALCALLDQKGILNRSEEHTSELQSP